MEDFLCYMPIGYWHFQVGLSLNLWQIDLEKKESLTGYIKALKHLFYRFSEVHTDATFWCL